MGKTRAKERVSTLGGEPEDVKFWDGEDVLFSVASLMVGKAFLKQIITPYICGVAHDEVE